MRSRMYRRHIRAIVGRTNKVTGTAYKNDPTIMAWQLANEPRPAGSDAVGLVALPAFQAWVQGTARLIRSLAPRQLVSTGSEGPKGTLEREAIVKAEHRSRRSTISPAISGRSTGAGSMRRTRRAPSR